MSERAPRIDPRLFDAVVTAALAAAAVVALFYYADPTGVDYAPGDALGVAIVLAVTVPLLVRRRWAFAVGMATAVGILAFLVWDYAMPTAAAVILIAVYSAGNYANLGASLAVLAAHLMSTLAYAYANAERRPDQFGLDTTTILLNAALLAGAWGAGRTVRNRRLYTAELEDRTRRLEQAGQAEIRAAIAEERSRIARELHDVVAHHVSVMTVQAAGARRTLTRDPQRSEAALQAIEDTGRSALSEMRRMVGVLRGPDGGGDHGSPVELAPQPGLADVETLAEHVRAAGVPVEIVVEGEPQPLPLGVHLAAYRVIQEALTNTVKHGGPSTATVWVRYQPDELHVHVSDDGNGMAAALEDRPRGHGLLGMRERVALYGGTLHAGPRRGGGFDVTAVIPYDHQPTHAKTAEQPER